MVVREKDGLIYRISDEEEFKKTVETAYNLIANECADWAADYIAEAKSLGFLDGVTEILYKEDITREMFCDIIYNTFDKTMNIEWNNSEKNPFDDTNDNKVSALYSEGIIFGKDKNTFSPEDNLTREEAATIIVRAVRRFLPETPVTEMYFEYDDISEVAQWAFDSVQLISNLGIMSGVGENKFAPKESYSAEQAVTALTRMYEKIISL